jgi:hypothetical protein
MQITTLTQSPVIQSPVIQATDRNIRPLETSYQDVTVKTNRDILLNDRQCLTWTEMFDKASNNSPCSQPEEIW